MRRAGTLSGAALLLLLIAVAGCLRTTPERPSVGVEGVFPVGTPTPAGYRPGLACVRCQRQVWQMFADALKEQED